MKKLFTLWALLLTSLAAGGCGYTWGSPFPKDVASVAVPTWERSGKEYTLEVEIELTQALTRAIRAHTPYKILPRQQADTVLEGTVLKVDRHVLSFDPRSRFAREIQVQVEVDFTWKDQRTGKIRAQKKSFRVSSEYIPVEPFAENEFLARQDIMDKLARRIVEQMYAPW